MPPRNSLRQRIQRGHTPDQVQKGIEATIFGTQNRYIMTQLLCENRTYEDLAEDKEVDMSPRGLKDRVKRIAPALENYMDKLN